MSSADRGEKGTESDTDSDCFEAVPDTYPDEFVDKDYWVTWMPEGENGRKIPRAPWETGDPERYISALDSDYQVEFDEVETWADMMDDLRPGFVIQDREPDERRPVLFDFDNCRDPETEEIHPEAWEFVQSHNLHAAVSISGTGLHGYGYATEVPGDRSLAPVFPLSDWDDVDGDPECEVYANSRFVAMTGEKLVGSGTELPDVTDLFREMAGEYGRERTDAETHEPERNRDEVTSIEKTKDPEVIYDAVKQTRADDISLDSTVTEKRSDGVSLNPSWEHSESGTRLWQDDEGWLYRKGDIRLTALQVVALEERVITDPRDYPRGDEYWTAVEALRNRGAPIPEYITPELDDETLDEIIKNPEVIHSDWLWEKVKDRYELTDDKDAVRQMVAVIIEDSGWFRTHSESENIYAYDPKRGVFVADGEGRLKELLERKLTKHVTNHELKEIVEKVKRRTRGTDFDPPDGMVCVANGVLDFDEMKLYDHAAEYEFQSGLRVEYDTDAGCPRWQEFIKSTFDSEAHIKRVQEYVGYTLAQGRMPVARSLFIAGPRDTGKSVFLDTVRRLFHDGSVASVTPQNLVDNRWRLAELEGKMVNVRSDIDDEMIENAGLWKEITTGDEVMAERKHEHPFSFRPTAKHIYATNKLPTSEVDDDAFFKRVMLVTATNQVPNDEKVRDMDEKFETEWDELPGILNWAVEGLERLRKNNWMFTGYPESGDRRIEITRENWRAYAKSGIRWIEQCTKVDHDGFVPYKLAYPSYVKFCDRQGIPQQSKRKFGQMVDWDDAVTRTNGRSDDIGIDDPVRGFRGISLLDEWNPAKELLIEDESCV